MSVPDTDPAEGHGISGMHASEHTSDAAPGYLPARLERSPRRAGDLPTWTEARLRDRLARQERAPAAADRRSLDQDEGATFRDGARNGSRTAKRGESECRPRTGPAWRKVALSS